MKKAKILSIVLAGCMALSTVLAGCGSTSASSSASSGSERKKVTITVFRQGSGLPDPSDDVLKKALDKALDIDLQMSVLSGKEYRNQLNVRVASGDAPDLFWVDKDTLREYASKNFVLDLSQHYKNELKPVADVLGENTLRLGMVDGKYYAVPSPSAFQYKTYWIRQDWLDNLGLEMPTTVDEMLEVAKAFATRDPDQNGKQDTMGIAGNGFEAFIGVLNYYGIPTWNSFYKKDGKLTQSYYDEDMPKALTKMKEFVDAGVMDPELFGNQTNQVLQTKAFQGQVGIVYMNWSDMAKDEQLQQIKAANPKAKWVQVPAMKGEYGTIDGFFNVGTTGHIFAIPASLEKDPEKLQRVFELLNYVSSGEGADLVQYGIEGVHFTRENGKIKKVEGSDWSQISQASLYQFTGRANELEYLSTRFPNQMDVIEFAKNQPRGIIYNGFVSTPEGYNLADANRYAEEEHIKFVYGQRNLGEYGAFLDTLNNTFGFKTYADNGIAEIEAMGLTQ